MIGWLPLNSLAGLKGACDSEWFQAMVHGNPTLEQKGAFAEVVGLEWSPTFTMFRCLSFPCLVRLCGSRPSLR